MADVAPVATAPAAEAELEVRARLRARFCQRGRRGPERPSAGQPLAKGRRSLTRAYTAAAQAHAAPPPDEWESGAHGCAPAGSGPPPPEACAVQIGHWRASAIGLRCALRALRLGMRRRALCTVPTRRLHFANAQRRRGESKGPLRVLNPRPGAWGTRASLRFSARAARLSPTEPEPGTHATRGRPASMRRSGLPAHVVRSARFSIWAPGVCLLHQALTAPSRRRPFRAQRRLHRWWAVF